MKYSDFICKTLKEMGYTHCFTLTGGNIMHLIESASNYFTIVPVVNEVAAGIAVEYFNESQENAKAFALVTAGPGLTNIITAMAGAFLESRDLLVIGGQVKTADLAHGTLRQRGIQEIDGISLTKSITKLSKLFERPYSQKELSAFVNIGISQRKGPVFLEIPLDIQAKQINEKEFSNGISEENINPMQIKDEDIFKIAELVRKSKRPMFLIGGGVKRSTVEKLYPLLENLSVPFQTTWNGADRIGSEHYLYFGRPNTWGQRYANILMQQSDCLIALGTRLGLQQTGFNWQKFIPNGKVVQVECDEAELNKGHPYVDFKICGDANHFLEQILKKNLGEHKDWLDFCNDVKVTLPLNEKYSNTIKDGYILSYTFNEILGKISTENDIILQCSSGGAATTAMQCFPNKKKQIIIGDKALASMGYGLSGAIGCAFSHPQKRVILMEGDGGFSQNLQELGVVNRHSLNIKIFIFENSGYASIRMTQKSYFNGKYVGCDINTGLGFPNWKKLFEAYSIPSMEISNESFADDAQFTELFENSSPAAFIVYLDPEQTYFPKITSMVTEDGSMESNPLHLMSPDLPKEIQEKVIKFI